MTEHMPPSVCTAIEWSLFLEQMEPSDGTRTITWQKVTGGQYDELVVRIEVSAPLDSFGYNIHVWLNQRQAHRTGRWLHAILTYAGDGPDSVTQLTAPVERFADLAQRAKGFEEAVRASRCRFPYANPLDPSLKS